MSVFLAVQGGCQFGLPKFLDMVVVTGETFGPVAANRLSSGVSMIHEAKGVKQ